MDQLITSLPALLRAAGDTEDVRKVAAIAAWNHVAGESLRQQTQANDLQQNRLIVAVEDDIWKRQLEAMRGQLAHRLSRLLGPGVVAFIEFRVDQRAVKAARDSRAMPRADTRRESERPIPFELIAAATAIPDSKLRKAFLGAAMSCEKRRETK
jgi:hypothetical protein